MMDRYWRRYVEVLDKKPGLSLRSSHRYLECTCVFTVHV